MPESTRFCWPLHHRPTKPNCCPYFLNTESSMTQVHCQRLCVAGLLVSTWRQSGYQTSRPKRRSRLSQERLGRAPRKREGQFLSQPRTRHNSEGVRQPKSAGNITPTILPRSFCWLCKRPSISATTVSGRPIPPGPGAGPRPPVALGVGLAQGALERCGGAVSGFGLFFGVSFCWGTWRDSFKPLYLRCTVRRKLCPLRS